MTATPWAIVLAAGEGSRLRALTTTESGVSVPKQFCSLSGGASLVQLAIRRAAAIATAQRTLGVVARQHRNWWGPQLARLPRRNLVVQPENRGTAHGILLPLLRIAVRDPEAVVVLLPADHYLRDEAVLADSLRDAAGLAALHCDELFLLGMTPEAADPDLGYIVPESTGVGTVRRVQRFVEKPAAELARRLLEGGALWNVFILAGTVRAFIAMFVRRMPDSLKALQSAMHSEQQLAALYARLGTVDFSRDVLEFESDRLCVVSTGKCGWTDLGTPERLADTLRQGVERTGAEVPAEAPGSLNLADQHRRRCAWARADLQGAGL